MQPFFTWSIYACLAGASGLSFWVSTLSLPTLVSDYPTNTEVSTNTNISVSAFDPSDDDRGSGRLRQRVVRMTLSFRGSGRVNPNPTDPKPPSAVLQVYRGSGRIQPNPSLG